MGSSAMMADARKALHTAKIALIAVAVAAGLFGVCFFIITAYVTVLLVQALS